MIELRFKCVYVINEVEIFKDCSVLVFNLVFLEGLWKFKVWGVIFCILN